jgi:hemolysin activation/secretion protein
MIWLALGPIPGADVAAEEAPVAPSQRRLDVLEYRVSGATRLTAAEVEAALAPFLGPGRPLEEVEAARAALERAYSERGWQAVTVAIPQQKVVDGVVSLVVTEGTVARLRVRGARWFSPFDVRALAPSLAEGAVPNFNDIVRDMYVLNQLPDRRVTPSLRAGVLPGTVDVDLDVEDRLPLHASLEVNDRYSASTTPLRLNGLVHYDNLWQQGHSLSFSFQLAPTRLGDCQVYSGSYLARFPGVTWLSVTATAIRQDSDVSTLGGIAVTGRGRIYGARATFTLPASASLFQTVTVGLDNKRFLEDVTMKQPAGAVPSGGPAQTIRSPITYWPVSAQYAASWQHEGASMQGAATVTFNLRSVSSNPAGFDAKRYHASGSFIYLRGELSRTDEGPFGIQFFQKVQGQLAAEPLIGSEQFAVGGMDSVRGYLEAQAVGDFGLGAQLEARSPSLGKVLGASWVTDWRFFAFLDAARAGLREPLPEQTRAFPLWSLGGGTRFSLFEHLAGALEVGVPMRTSGATVASRPRFHFRLWGEF